MTMSVVEIANCRYHGSMARFLYSTLFYLLQPLVLARLCWRSLRAPAYRRRMRERYGRGGDFRSGGIWLHAVSVGETIASVPLVKALQQAYPELPLMVTTTTPTGSAQVQRIFAGSVDHVYAPYDLPGSAGHFIDRLQPCLFIIMETELWPNLIHACSTRNIPVIVANARLSERSARGYARLPGLVRPMMSAISTVAVQTAVERDRFVELGVQPERAVVCGSIKFDIEIDAAEREQASQRKKQWSLMQRPVWIAASTHEGEDAIVLAAHKQLLSQHPNALLILVPRHPERFDQVASLCEQEGMTITRRSSEELITERTQVLLGDTMGELLALYGLAQMAFIGGSLQGNGGHNMLEAAAWGMPILSGPDVFNFQEISDRLVAAGAMTIVADAGEMAATVAGWTEDSAAAAQAGTAAAELLAANRGAGEKLLSLIGSYLD